MSFRDPLSGKSVTDALNEAADLVGRGWCQGVLAMDARGHEVDADSPTACRWCADGALMRSCAGTELYSDMWYALANVTGGQPALWNDHSERTQAEVVAKLREAAKRADEVTHA